MSENRKDIQVVAEATDRGLAQWQRPRVSAKNANTAEIDVNANTDGAAFS
jgi:hypothetical protein